MKVLRKNKGTFISMQKKQSVRLISNGPCQTICQPYSVPGGGTPCGSICVQYCVGK